MSTKIYNAYKINNMSMTEIMDVLYEMKIQTNESIKDIFRDNSYSKELQEKYDYNSFKKMVLDTHTKNLNCMFNWNSSVVLFFHQDNIYIVFFGLLYSIDKHELFKGNLVDFHYQNQSDPWYDFDLEEGTDEYKEAEIEWEQRKTIWDEIIGNRYSYSDSGLVYDLFNKDDCFMLVGDLWNIIESYE